MSYVFLGASVVWAGSTQMVWARPQITLSGLFVNGAEIETIDTLVDDGTYYLPFDLLVQQMGVTPTSAGDRWQFHLPIGEASIPHTAIVRHNDIDYLPLDATKPLGITAKYNAQLLAIQLYVPWDNTKPFKDTHSNRNEQGLDAGVEQQIDYFPETMGLTNLSVTGNFSYQRETQLDPRSNTVATEQVLPSQPTGTDSAASSLKTRRENHGVTVGMMGYMSGGTWAANLQYIERMDAQDGIDANDVDTGQERSSVRINNAYWTQSDDNTAVRIGTATNGYGGITGSSYTGATFGYSSRDITPHLSSQSANNTSLLGTGGYHDIRNISGTGPAGGVAELRVNGSAIARVRIALDERYEFIGLNVGSHTHAYDVEVAIYEYSAAGQPLRIDKPLLASRQSNVATDELLVEAGVGTVGNLLDDLLDDSQSETAVLTDSGIYTHLYAEYGVSNNVAVRAAVATTWTGGRDTLNQKVIDTQQIAEEDLNRQLDALVLGNTTVEKTVEQALETTARLDVGRKHQTSALLGINVGFSKHINWDIAYRHTPETYEVDSYLAYHSKAFDASYQVLETHRHRTRHDDMDVDDVAATGLDNRRMQHINLSMRPTHWLSLYLNGIRLQQGDDAEQYLTARAYAKLNENLNVSLYRDRYHNHSYGVNWSLPEEDARIRLAGDRYHHGVYASKYVSSDLQLGGAIRHKKDDAQPYYHAFADYSPSDKHALYAGYHHHRSDQGYELKYQYRPHDFGSWHLGYRTNQSMFSTNEFNAGALDVGSTALARSEQDYFFLQFRFDFFNHPTKGLVRGYQHNSHSGGRVVTNIGLEGSDTEAVFDEKIQLKLNNQLVDAYRVAGNQYMINNVKAGTYAFAFPESQLPLEYQANELAKPVIKVAKSATTIVPVQLQKTYGVSGQLMTEAKGVKIGIYQRGKLVKEVSSRAYGYYQVTGLPAGSYSIKAPGYHERAVMIEDAFVFGMNISFDARHTQFHDDIGGK